MLARGAETFLEWWLKRVDWGPLRLMLASSFTLGAMVAGAAFLDGDWADLGLAEWVHRSVFPALILLIIGVQPILAWRFTRALDALQEHIDLTPGRLSAFISKTSNLRTAWEWAPFVGGALVALVVERPWLWPFEWSSAVDALGGALCTGALCWLVATSLLRTQLLGHLRRGALQLWPLDPTVRWSLEVALVVAGLALAGLLFMLNRPDRLAVIVYGGTLLLLIFVFLLSRVLARLISSVYQSRILYAVILMLVTAAVGTIGYQVLEGWDLMDGLYMTVISMTTVGYGETRPLTPSGRIFTMFLIVASIGIAGYAISTVAGYVVEGEFNRLFRGRRMKKEISKLENHIILCGSGRVGREIATEFYKTLTPFVIVEPKEESLQEVPFLDEIPHLLADPTRDQVLKDAGVEKASGLVAALHDDQTNLFLVLSARALNPKLRIIARLADDANERKLMRAGASAVVHPEAIGGLRMASMMIRPDVVTFLDQMLRVTGKTLRVEELKASPSMAGKTLQELNLSEAAGLLTMALKARGRGGYEFNPPASTQIEEGDVLIVMGTPQQLATARNL